MCEHIFFNTTGSLAGSVRPADENWPPGEGGGYTAAHKPTSLLGFDSLIVITYPAPSGSLGRWPEVEIVTHCVGGLDLPRSVKFRLVKKKNYESRDLCPTAYSRSHELSDNKVGLEAGLWTPGLGLSLCFLWYSSLFRLRNRSGIFLKASSPLHLCNLETCFLVMALPKWLFQFLLLVLFALFIFSVFLWHTCYAYKKEKHDV